jgi:probable O-glycosylation ligase (exosortase A-associated)
MKQLLLIILLTLIGTAGAVTIGPFWGIFVYYLFAVLRPQYIWDWALEPYGALTIRWSFYVGIMTILAATAYKVGFFSSAMQKKEAEGGTGASPVDRRDAGPTLSAAHLWVLAFGVWIVVSYLRAKRQEVAYPWFIEYLKIFVMFATSALLIRAVREVWMLFIMAAVAVGYIGYEINAQYFEYRRIIVYFTGYGGLDNNGAGLLLAMGVPLCLFVWEGMQRWWRWLFAGLIPVLIHAVLLSFSRGAMVALLAASPLFFIRSRHKRYLLVGGFVLILMMLPRMAGPEIRARFFSIQEYEKDKSVQGRFNSWQVAWEIAKDNPITGLGVRNASEYAREYSAEAEGRTIHSQYLQILADNGFVGFGFYLGSLVAVWLSVRRARQTSKGWNSPEERTVYAIACGVECSMAVFCVGASFLSLELFELPYLLLLLGAQLPVVMAKHPEPAAAWSPPRQEHAELVNAPA